jgi:hypothetical protein
MHSHPTELTGPHTRVHALQANAHCQHRHARTMQRACCALLHTHHLYALPNNTDRENIRPSILMRNGITGRHTTPCEWHDQGWVCDAWVSSIQEQCHPLNIHATTHPSVPLCVRAHTPDRDAHGTTPTVCDVTWMSSRFGKRAGKWAAAQGARGLLCGASCGDGVVCVVVYGKIQHGAEHMFCDVLCDSVTQ